MVYITENNGVYGLTKGQFSATADKGSKSKAGGTNNDSPIDLVGMALMIGATFVARSFSGDKTQLVPLIKAAIAHKGPAFIDVISPCVAFNNHAGSTKSFDYRARAQRGGEPARLHRRRASRSRSITRRARPKTSTLHDGSVIRLAKLHKDYDPHDRVAAMNYMHSRAAAGELVTGLIYMDPNPGDLHASLNTIDTPLNRLGAKELCPGSAALEKINASLR